MTSDKKIPCEIYTRCVGYFRPVNQFNPGKKQEFSERVNYAVPDIFPHGGKRCSSISQPLTVY